MNKNLKIVLLIALVLLLVYLVYNFVINKKEIEQEVEIIKTPESTQTQLTEVSASQIGIA